MCCTKVKVSLALKDEAQAVFRPKRPVAYHALGKIDDELQRLLNSNIISPTDYSEWAAPIVVVQKPNGSIRICADYSTGLNKALKQHHYPIPTPEQIFATLSNCSIFAHIDLSDAYLQIKVDEASSKLLTINTHRGLFNFNRLAPGITSAPGHFQQTVETMLAGIDHCSVYFDDICMAGSSAKTLYQTIIKVFKRLNEFGFQIKMEKCKFFVDEICYLGNVINKNGIHPDRKRIEAILKMPAPKNVSELRSFLGAIHFYGKFIKNMRTIRAPMDQLLSSGTKWTWTESSQTSFNKFKDILNSDLMLTHYNPALPVFVAADASNVGVGACIYHQYPDNSIKIIYHASRALTPAETNYGQIEKEGLALVYAVTKFHRFIFGRKCTLVTDHKPLLAIFGSKKGIPVHSASRLQRWAITLLAYDFDIQYTSTTEIGHADVLSRLISNKAKPEEDIVIASTQLEADVYNIFNDVDDAFPVNFKMIQQATIKCPILCKVSKYVDSNRWPTSKHDLTGEVALFFNRKESLSLISNCLLFSDRVVIPAKYQQNILRTLHESHPGMQRMKSMARGYVYWPRMDKAIEDFVRTCGKCAAAAKSPIKSTLYSWPLPSKPWERIHMDYAGPINGYFYLVVIDAYSKWPEIVQTPTITTTATTKILSELYARFGNVDVIVSDNGTQFTSDQFMQFNKQRGIIHIRTSPFHPQSNGLAERYVDTLKTAFAKMNNPHINQEELQLFLQTYRATPNPNSPGGKSPAEAFLGRQLKTKLHLLKIPTNTDKLRNRNINQEWQYNTKHGAKDRFFSVNTNVYAKVYRGNKFTWESGSII